MSQLLDSLCGADRLKQCAANDHALQADLITLYDGLTVSEMAPLGEIAMEACDEVVL